MISVATSPFKQLLVREGFALLDVDFRGSTGYGRRWRDRIIGDVGFPELEDVCAGADDLIARGLADRIKIGKPIHVMLDGDVAQTLGAILRDVGVTKGDRVIIYMPMVPEAVFSMLACARIGAIHSVVFGGFASVSLASRIDDASPKLIVSADAGRDAIESGIVTGLIGLALVLGFIMLIFTFAIVALANRLRLGGGVVRLRDN